MLYCVRERKEQIGEKDRKARWTKVRRRSEKRKRSRRRRRMNK